MREVVVGHSRASAMSLREVSTERWAEEEERKRRRRVKRGKRRDLEAIGDLGKGEKEEMGGFREREMNVT